MYMQGQKSYSFKLFLWKNIFVAGASFVASFLGLSFNTSEASALFVPTLSASVDQANLQVNGNSVINSTDKTTEIPFNFTVNTNNHTGYTATLSAETDNTALTNTGSAVGAKIDSISANLTLNNLPNNTWGFKFGGTSNYSPIPSLSDSANLFSTTAKTSGNESFDFKIGMKLSDNLESGNYTNKLIISIVSNPYERRAVMTTGKDFNDKMEAFDPQRAGESSNGFRIKHFKRSVAEPVASDNAIGVESADLSDYEIKLWFNLAEETMYYYSPVETTFLNPNSAAMFAWFIKLQDIDLSHFNTSEVENMMQMFIGLYSCTSLDLSTFDTRNVTSMYQMFAHDRSLVNLNLANFNTWLVTDMAGMFEDLSNVVSLGLSSFDTYNVTDMNHMFYLDSKLANLNVSSFNTSNVINMEYMFNSTKALLNLDLSQFNTKNVTNMAQMFGCMEAIVNLNVNSFDTSKVTTMNGMFSSMLSLGTLDISSFNTQNVEDMGYIFAIDNGDRDNLTTIYASDGFVADNVVNSQGIFNYRKKLRGGNGSYLIDPNTADKSWLRVDRPGVQGYFTRRS